MLHDPAPRRGYRSVPLQPSGPVCADPAGLGTGVFPSRNEPRVEDYKGPPKNPDWMDRNSTPIPYSPKIRWGRHPRSTWGPPVTAKSYDKWVILYKCPKCQTGWEIYAELTEKKTELFCHKDGTRQVIPLPLPVDWFVR